MIVNGDFSSRWGIYARRTVKLEAYYLNFTMHYSQAYIREISHFWWIRSEHFKCSECHSIVLSYYSSPRYVVITVHICCGESHHFFSTWANYSAMVHSKTQVFYSLLEFVINRPSKCCTKTTVIVIWHRYRKINTEHIVCL